MTAEYIFYAISAPLTLALAGMTLHRLLSGWWKQYYLLVLLLVLLIVGVVPAISSYANYGDWTSAAAQKMYWTLALAQQAVTFALVLQLIYRTGEELPAQASVVRLLTLVAVIAAGVSVYLHMDRKTNTFMTLVARDLTFLTALSNLVLWRFLLVLRKRPPELLAVSVGLGIQCAGDAIGHSLRMMSRHFDPSSMVHEFGNIFMSLSSAVMVLVWYSTFTRHKYGARKLAAERSRNRAVTVADQPATVEDQTTTVSRG